MTKSLKSLFAAVAFGASALALSAQTAPKILVVDLAKLFDGHYKTEEQNTKFRADEAKASAEFENLNKDGQVLVEQYKEMAAQAENPALTAEAKAKAVADAQKKGQDIQSKQAEVQNFRANVARQFQQRMANFREVMIDEISKIATDIAKKKGATLLIDKSSRSMSTAAVLIYADPSYDITDEVAAEINKGRPAGSSIPTPTATPTVAPNAANPAVPSGTKTDSPAGVTFPSTKK